MFWNFQQLDFVVTIKENLGFGEFLNVLADFSRDTQHKVGNMAIIAILRCFIVH